MSEKHSAFAAAMDKIVADCNDRLEWVLFCKDRLTKQAARVERPARFGDPTGRSRLQLAGGDRRHAAV